MVNSFTVNPDPAKRCDGCGVIVGKGHPVQTGIIVKEGLLTGFFHSHQCYENAWKQKNPEEDLQL